MQSTPLAMWLGECYSMLSFLLQANVYFTPF
nr:MAG TPA: hypothetical protein [Caudoviricetes sp.]